MGNKPKSQKPTDDGIARIDQAIKIATEQKDEEIARLKEKISLARQIFETSGKIKTVAFFESQTRLMRLLFLKQSKDNKDYREKFGMTWEEFCIAAGENRRRIDELLLDLKPFKADWLAKFVTTFGVEIHKIKYLGEAISAESANFKDNSIIYQGEEIPLTPEHKDEIQALLEKLEESYKAQLEEKSAVIRTKDKLIQSQGDLVHRQEKTISKFEREAAKQGLTLEEDAFIKKVENLRIGFDGYMLSLDPDRIEELLPKSKPTPRMVSSYIAALKYMKMQILAAHDAAIESYADPSMLPEEEWQPPPDARAPVYPKHRSNKAEA